MPTSAVPPEAGARDGFMVRLGVKHGIPTPLHRAMVGLVGAMTGVLPEQNTSG